MPGHSPMPSASVPCSTPASNRTWRPDADGQHGTAAGDAAADHADGVDGLELAHDRFERADAGDDEAVGVEHVLRLGAEDDLGTGPLERADGGTDVAGAVVEDRDGGLALGRRRLGAGGGVDDGPVAGAPGRSQRTLGRRDALDAGIRLDGGAQGAGEGLELGLDDVVRVAPGGDVHVQADPGVQGDRLEDVAGQGAGEVAADQVVFLAGRLAAVDQVRAAGDVDDGLREGLVEGNGRLAETADPGLVARARCAGPRRR